MIPRYTPALMAELWNDSAKWSRVLDVELTTAEVLAEDGVIPRDAAQFMRANAKFDVDQITENEKIVRHDVIAFLQSVGDSLGEHKRWLHVGLTSYDVVDTALSMALRDAGELIRTKLLELRDTLEAQAEAHKLTLMPGRTHGVHAEHTTLGWKICGWIAELDRDIQRWHYALQRIAVGKISGAVGSFPTITPDQEARICAKLGLEPDPISTQVISRDRHAEYMNVLALIGGLVERMALEVRLLQHSEVEELLEPFGTGQRGSSAMPHKKNPVVTENLCGLARLVRANASAELENMPLWHERDISHSSIERVILPDTTSLVYFMLDKINWVVGNWNVDVAKMRAHVDQDRGLMNSGLVLTALKLAGIDDDDIYKRVQSHALASRESDPALIDRIKGDADIMAVLTAEQVDAIFDDTAVLKRADIPLERVAPFKGRYTTS